MKSAMRQLAGLSVAMANNGVRTIAFDVPRRKNAVSSAMFADMVTALEEAANDKHTKITVVTGTGDYFTSGNDQNNFLAASSSGQTMDELAASTVSTVERFVAAFIDHPKLLVARVNGPAIGIGATLIGLCDLVYASDAASVTTPFVKLALVPEGCSSLTYPRLMGRGKALRLFLLGEPLSAAEAEACGLFTKVFPKAHFEHSFDAEIQKMAVLPYESLLACKDLVRRWDSPALHAANSAEMRALERRIASEEAMQAVLQFMQEKASKAKL